MVDAPTVALGVIGLYLVVIFGIAVWSYQRTDLGHLQDYFLMDRSLGPIIGVLTIFATFQSGYYMLGNVGFFYLFGSPWVLGSLATSPMVGVMIWYFGSRFWVWSKEEGHLTISRMYGTYYESKTLRGFVGVLTALFIIPYIGVQLIAGAVAIEGITAGLVSYQVGVIFMLVVILLYTIVGGFRAVTVSDAIQGLFFFLIMWALTAYFLVHYGGVGGFFNALTTEHPTALTADGLIGAEYAFLHLGLMFGVVFGFLFQPYIFHRIIAAKNLKTVQSMSVWIGIIVLIGYISTMFVGFGILTMEPDIANPDSALPVFLERNFPLIGSVVIASAIAAMMSTADSHLITAAATTVDDVYRPFFNDDPEPSNVKTVTWALMVGLMLAAGALAFVEPGFIVDITLIAFAGFATLIWAGLGMMHWDWATAEGTIASAGFGGLVVLLVYQGLLPFLPAITFDYIIYSFIASFVAFVVVSLVTQSPSQETRDRYQQMLDDYL